MDWDTCISVLNVTIPDVLLQVKVVDLVDNNGGWNFELIASWIPDEVMARFVAKPPPKSEDGQDVCLWPGSSSTTGSFTVSSAYNLLCHLEEDSNCDSWKKIWKLATKERVRHFVWLLVVQTVITVVLKRKLLYTFLGIALLFILFGFILCSHLNFRNLFTVAIGNTADLNWPALWANTCHLLWLWRNKMVHEVDYVMPWQP